jgi:branched-subunit amino acid ABC-type transport system permease component
MWLDLVQQGISGLLVGATYALIAIGFTMVWGVMRRLNLAYGAAALGAAYIGLWVYRLTPDLTPAILVLAAMGSGIVIGFLVDLVCFRWLPREYELAPLMSTLGALIIAEEAINFRTRGYPQSFPEMLPNVLHLGPLFLRLDHIVIFGVCLLMVGGLYYLLFRTKLGLTIRAVSQQVVAAQLMGMNPDRTNALTFMLTGMLAGAAGALAVMAIGTGSSALAITFTLRGLFAAVIGGLGSIPGAIVGGLALGVIEAEALRVFGIGYRDVFTNLALLAVLVFRPHGIMGARLAQ